MDYDSNVIEKCILYSKQINSRFYRSILATWEMLKENAGKSKNFAFICSEINFSLYFTLEKYITYYISIKIQPCFIYSIF